MCGRISCGLVNIYRWTLCDDSHEVAWSLSTCTSGHISDDDEALLANIFIVHSMIYNVHSAVLCECDVAAQWNT